MSEVQFAKSFMTVLDKRPVKLSSDFVSDPKKYPAQPPVTLSKPAVPFPKPQSASTITSSISVTLKPMKPPTTAVTLTCEASTTVLDLKTQFSTASSLDTSKIKLLYNKRPASDLKTLSELLPTPAPAAVEFSVMILGGTATPPVATPAASTPAVEAPDPVASAVNAAPTEEEKRGSAPLSEKAEEHATETVGVGAAAEVLKSTQFWADLKDFLVQRLRDEGEGERLLEVFRSASQGS